jgi:hypothetical protein
MRIWSISPSVIAVLFAVLGSSCKADDDPGVGVPTCATGADGCAMDGGEVPDTKPRTEAEPGDSTCATGADGCAMDSGEVPDTKPRTEAEPGDSEPASCILSETSSLPQVRLEFRTTKCTFSVTQAAAGISIPYDLVVDEDVPGYVFAAFVSEPIVAGAPVSEVLAGGSQKYCICDNRFFPICPNADGGLRSGDAGLCDPVTLRKGIYHRTFDWDGRNWTGPSDTFAPKGPPFPPGDYTLTIELKGQLEGDVRANVDVVSQLRVHLIP